MADAAINNPKITSPIPVPIFKYLKKASFLMNFLPMTADMRDIDP